VIKTLAVEDVDAFVVALGNDPPEETLTDDFVIMWKVTDNA
jgi:hypothetical protein